MNNMNEILGYVAMGLSVLSFTLQKTTLHSNSKLNSLSNVGVVRFCY
jgi:hypothetical protein